MSNTASAVAHTPRKNRDLRRTAWLTNGDGRGLAPEQENILDLAFRYVQSVDYPVDKRWLFYKLLEEGVYKDKKDFKGKFDHLISKARHTCFKEWRPDTLVDESREIIVRAGGYAAAEDAGDDVRQNILDAARISVDHFHRQNVYVQIWFEARCMVGQFRKYTRAIDLCPMGGMASIPFKFAVAKSLTEAARIYEKPIRILYFGDEDEAGHKIARVSEKDVRRWTDVPFEIVWCGLTAEQIEHYKVPVNFERKGHQWVALGDGPASEIITAAVEEHVDTDLIAETEEEAEAFAEEWAERLEAAIGAVEKAP